MNKAANQAWSLNIKGKVHEFPRPLVMSIININGDSFYSGSRVDENQLLKRIENQLDAGADWIDIGAQSSRPGAEKMSLIDEVSILKKATQSIKKEFPKIVLSIDSYHAVVQEACLEEGSDIINDIGAEQEYEKMALLSKKFQAPYILMHMRGNPSNMQEKAEYKNVVQEVIYELADKAAFLKAHGVSDLIIDPGFGFAKNLEQNHLLLQNLSWFHQLSAPLLIGISRKSMLYKALNINPNEALAATNYANGVALCKGAHILRVHDTKDAAQIVELHHKFA